MKKIKLILVGILIIVLLMPTTTLAAEQPETLADAVTEIKQMFKEGKTSWEIADRTVKIADKQILNKNSLERMSIWNHWSPFQDSEEDKNFNDWVDNNGGGDASYDKSAEWVWESGYGQCNENANLVYYILKTAGAENVRIFAQQDHAFVVWGMDVEADPNKKESWTNDVIALDSWEGFALRGEKAFNSWDFCARGRVIVADATYMKDNTVQPRCGFSQSECCKTIAPCRDTERLACFNGICVLCGITGAPCCNGATECYFSNNVCEDEKCVKEEESVLFLPTNCPVPSGANHKVSTLSEFWYMGAKVDRREIVGPYQAWYDIEQTQKKSFICYDDEHKKQGVAKNWYEDGTLSAEWNYKDGQKDGICKNWCEDGKLSWKCNYKDGEINGICKTWTWYEDGTLKSDSTGNYNDDGSMQESIRGWFEDGTPSFENNYKDNEFHGIQKNWYTNGESKECIYENGNKVGECEYTTPQIGFLVWARSLIDGAVVGTLIVCSLTEFWARCL